MAQQIEKRDIQGYLDANPKVSEWMTQFKPPTQTLYARQLIRFERLSQTTIEQLLHKAKNNLIEPTQIRTLIIQTTKQLSNPSQVMTDAAVRSFLKYFGRNDLPKTTIKYQETQFYRGYTKLELNQLLGYLDKPLEKLYVIIGAESGLRATAILQLKWRHIAREFDTREDPIAIKLEPTFYKGRKKSGYTFIGLRARELINKCLEADLISTQPEAELFPYTDSSIRAIIQTAKHKAALDPTIHPIHGLRKYFKAALESPKPPIDEYHQRMMMGRFSDVDAKAYSPRDFETLRPEYKHAYPYLDYMNNAPEQTQELSTKQTELQDIISQQNQRMQRLEQVILRKQEVDSGILAILQSPTALRRTATLVEYIYSKKIPDQAINAVETVGLPLTPENVMIATDAYMETHPEIIQAFLKSHPEFIDPQQNKKGLAELKRALTH